MSGSLIESDKRETSRCLGFGDIMYSLLLEWVLHWKTAFSVNCLCQLSKKIKKCLTKINILWRKE